MAIDFLSERSFVYGGYGSTDICFYDMRRHKKLA
jgi:hypothetical protein